MVRVSKYFGSRACSLSFISPVKYIIFQHKWHLQLPTKLQIRFSGFNTFSARCVSNRTAVFFWKKLLINIFIDYRQSANLTCKPAMVYWLSAVHDSH